MSAPTPSLPPARQAEILAHGVRGVRPRVPVNMEELEARAKHAMSDEARAYIGGGAGSESTMRANRAAFDRWCIVPRVLRDVAIRDTSVELFGRRLPSPVILSPIGAIELAHSDADLAVARAAATLGVPYVFSSQASVPMEACTSVMGNSPRWFQLYWSKDDELVASFVARAERCGCDAIVLTVDTTWLGWRTRDLDLGYLPFLHGKGIAQYTSDPVFMRKVRDPLPGVAPPRGRVTLAALRAALGMARSVPGGTVSNLRTGTALAAVRRFVATYARPSLTWADLPTLRAMTKLPILVKGILHPDDARRAVDSGMDGVVVSNHGGRQVDGSIASLDALPAVVAAVEGRVPVLVDSGIRGGADVFKAIALGARAVGLGRPYVFGLALAGSEGVREVVANVMGEFELTMGLAGCKSVGEIGTEAVIPG